MRSTRGTAPSMEHPEQVIGRGEAPGPGPRRDLHPAPQLLTLSELAMLWSVSPRTIRRWSATRSLPCVRVGRLVRFDPGDVSRWLSARKE